jgi:hypothetical protein
LFATPISTTTAYRLQPIAQAASVVCKSSADVLQKKYRIKV